MQRFPHVVEPLRLRHRTLRCRINLGAHTTNMGEDGLPSDRHVAYYRERALHHSAADAPARRRFARAGGEMAPHTVVAAWHGEGATLRSTLTGDERAVPFDWLVIAGTPVARTALAAELDRRGVAHTAIGDCLSPRTAAAAILDGRRVAQRT